MMHTIVDCPSAPSGKFDCHANGSKIKEHFDNEAGRVCQGYTVKTKTEYPTMTKAQKALKDVKLTSDDRKRIHKCFHNDKNKACEIING